MASHLLGITDVSEGMLKTHQLVIVYSVSYNIHGGKFVSSFALDGFAIAPLMGRRSQQMQPCRLGEGTPDSSYRCVARIRLKFAYLCTADGKDRPTSVVHLSSVVDKAETSPRLYTEDVVLEHCFHCAQMEFDVFGYQSEDVIMRLVKSALSS